MRKGGQEINLTVLEMLWCERPTDYSMTGDASAKCREKGKEQKGEPQL